MLIVFDLDGTLFQAKPVVLAAARRQLAELGAAPREENEILKKTARGARAFADSIGAGDPELALRRYHELLLESVRECGELFEGASDALARLVREGHELVVCSNSNEEYIGLALEKTGIAGMISRYVSAENHPSKAAAIARLIRPGAAAVVVGDTHGDIEAAQANGLPSIAAAYGYGNKSMLTGATLTAARPAELPDCVQRLKPTAQGD